MDVNQRDGSGVTPLMRAVRDGVGKSGGPEIVRVLLGAGADPNARDARGLTPLMLACASADAGTVALLLEHGADWRARSDRGSDWVDFARRQPRSDVLDFVTRYLKEKEKRMR